jgi:hypothetical protein
MASIDKTYADSYKEYQEFKDWAKDKEIVFNKKQKVRLSSYIYHWEEADFIDALPIMNTPTYVDIFLIKNCPLKFIQERMREVYDEGDVKEFEGLEFPLKVPKDYKQNRKVVISKAKTIPLYNKGLNSHSGWWLQSRNRDWDFDTNSNLWVNRNLYYPSNTNTSRHKTVKSLIRFLRKQYLPSGLEFILLGRYKGERFTIKIV